MAIFADNEEEWNRLDFRLLRDHPITLYRSLGILEEDLHWFTTQEYRTHRFNSPAWDRMEAFHDDVSRELSFPDYYGRNLDAFRDCLSDIEVPDPGGLVLVFIGFDAFASVHSRAAWDILDIIATQSRMALLFGKRLIAMVQSNDPEIAIRPVGSTPVGWNPREWLVSSRQS